MLSKFAVLAHPVLRPKGVKMPRYFKCMGLTNVNLLTHYQLTSFSTKTQREAKHATENKKKDVKNQTLKLELEKETTKFLFDKDNKTIVFKHITGESDLRWLVRGGVVFTILNTFLFVTEIATPIFGGWNLLSFAFGTFTGFGAMFFLHIFSRRTAHEIRLFRNGEYVEILYFNAFWKPVTKVYHLSEFANLQPSLFGMHRTELTSLGKVWINLDKNTYHGLKDYDDIVNEILNGKQVKLSRLEAITAKYKNYTKI
eukprot:TRINITY_DN7713_c0_g1_i1.p1 TRINITY_DN7713_c0_g1~~TRINITY_DN7713_c0_g1_i1.p1  ORF type:complete len:256 (-),score=61.17 TRINITY_DN7713_c0_g1_i1:152-919(-)